MNKELFDFVNECAKDHSPFKRECDNKKYQEKYFQIFELIYNKLPDINSSIQISVNDFQDTYRNYKQVLIDLYNDSLIYFCISSNKSLIHGNRGFSSKFKGEYKKNTFSSFYKLNDSLIAQINSGLYIKKYRNKLIKLNNNNKQYNNKITNNNKEYKQIYFTPSEDKNYTENKWYNYLTYENGDKFMEELPHYGEYEDGRIYSKFHTLKRILRENLMLCGEKIAEIFDISHCYPTLLGVLIGGHLEENVVNHYRNYIMKNDIYLDALDEAGIEKNKENRNKIKPYFNKFILSTKKDIKRNMKWEDETNDPKIFSAVVKFFKNRFPEIFDFIVNFETSTKIVNGRKKIVKNLAHELQKIEKIIIDNLTSKIEVPYLTLHDAIYIRESDAKTIQINFEEEFRKILKF